MQHFLVGTGIVCFHIQAETPQEAIEQLKHLIDSRRHVRKHPTISMSLVGALDEGRLNFVVFDATRQKIIAGELNGKYIEPATRALAASLPSIIPAALVFELKD